ncbi:MAG: hypothetical protein WC880_02875 [Candidatus Paceibacterota bacterium]
MSRLIEGGSDGRQPLVSGISTIASERVGGKYHNKVLFAVGCTIPLFIVTILATGATVFMLVAGVGDRLMGR